MSEVQSNDLQDPVVAPAEKLVPQSEVNDIVHKRTAAAIEKTRRETTEEVKRQYESQLTQSKSSSMGGMTQPGSEEIQRMIEESTQKTLSKVIEENRQQYLHDEYKKDVDNFLSKIDASKDRYPDLKDKIAELGLPTVASVVSIVNSFDNTADIMNDLAENPLKLIQIQALYKANPTLALKEMNKMSESIKKNQNALSMDSVDKPLRRITPSNSGMDNGSSTISNLRKNKWLKT